MSASVDVVVIGAGVVGAACAYYAAATGFSVLVVDRGSVAGGTTGRGEGNVLVSDKEPGPELDLALYSNRLWRELAAEIGEAAEIEAKGGLVVATDPTTLASLEAFAGTQRVAGVEAEDVTADGLAGLEPGLARDLAGGVLYPQDMQVNPMLAAAHLLRIARGNGAKLRTGCEVVGIQTTRDQVSGVRTRSGVISTELVVNAAGTWSGEIAALAGRRVPVVPRRGFILVTEPLPHVIRHKVYAADYVANVASGEEALQTSTVIEGTRSGTVLIGSTRERVGFDPAISWPTIGRIAAQAIRLLPLLAQVRALRAYAGFRPYCPDHLPIIGPDPELRGLIHACGHEGAGVGLAPATGRLVAQILSEATPDVGLAPFAPGRFEASLA